LVGDAEDVTQICSLPVFTESFGLTTTSNSSAPLPPGRSVDRPGRRVRTPLVHGPGRTLRVRSPSTRAAPAGVSHTARIWRDAAGIVPLRRVVYRTGP
jgi:hypothetical protein